MIETKIFEVRDRATCMPVIATRLVSVDMQTDDPTLPSEVKLIERAGFSNDFPQVVVHFLEPDEGSWDASKWSSRTRHVSHKHIANNWNKLNTGDVIDVEFILGETKQPKISEVL